LNTSARGLSRSILFVQLPIPPAGPSPIDGNVPLAAGYLILHARTRGLEQHFQFEILPPKICNYSSDLGIVQAIIEREPGIVGFSCYLWNIDRSLWIAAQLKRIRPDMVIVLGGPEITNDNAWVFGSGLVDFAVVGEGEQTFSELLEAILAGEEARRLIPGLWRKTEPRIPLFRKPLANLDEVSSPYLCGILNAADERMLLLETIRGCVFKCKFCYYPKSYDSLYFLSEEKIKANLKHAREAEVTEVILLDPTLNQRRDFDDFLRLLARENPGQRFTYFGELRSEGIKPETAKLLRAANFTEVEIGLQSVDPATQDLMDRRNNMKAFERGVSALLDAGIRVKVDLIIGLPGDTMASVRRGFDYLSSSKMFTSTQVFNLAILPGTAFRSEAEELGLQFQPRPPYYVLETPTLKTSDLYELMADAQDVFETEWDPFPDPKLQFEPSEWVECIRIDLDGESRELPAASERAQALTLWFTAQDFSEHLAAMQHVIQTVVQDCPHTTLQIVLEPTADPMSITSECVEQLLATCYRHPNYLDRYYSLSPQGLLGSKRVLIVVDDEVIDTVDADWADAIEESATLVGKG
jgi:Radical SAM superfamily/B12 binding domain